MPVERSDVRRIIDNAISSLERRFDELDKRIESIPKSLEPVTKLLEHQVEELKKPVKKTVIEEDALIAYPIRDTLTHRTRMIDIGDFDIITVFVNNELDQDIKVQVKGNFTPTHLNSVGMGVPFSVKAKEVEARNLSIYSVAWMPFSFCELKCDVAPTKGAVHVKYLKRVG